MKPGGGKAKGNGFEGQIAKKLSKALAPLSFIRSPGSGARLGGKNFAKFGSMFGAEAAAIFTGDVVPTNEKEAGLKFKYSVECKSYATSDNFPAIVNGTANFFKWFEESVVDAEKIGKEPILIVKWNRTATFVGINSGSNSLVKPRLTLSQNGRSIDVFDLDDLLAVPAFWVESQNNP